MKFNILKTRSGKLKHDLESKFLKKTINENDIQGIIEILRRYEKNNLETIEKLKKDKLYETKRISGALKQTIQAHSDITMSLIGSATKRIYGALLSNEKTNKEKICDKISSIYHTFTYVMIFIIKLEFMKKNKDKICVTVSKENNEKLVSNSINKSKLIDKLLTDYFKSK
jgi:hypothetical protein